MFLQLHKRRKLGDQENITFSMTKMGAKDQNGVERTLSKVIDYSDEHALHNRLEALADEKYGSVTKELERLCSKLENMKVYMSKLRTLSMVPASPILQSSTAALDAYNTPMASRKVDGFPTTKVETRSSSEVIVLSDEEDGEPQEGNKHVSSVNGEGQHYQLACLDPRSTKIGAPTSLEMNWQPSVQYQKVILQSVVDKHPIENPMERSSWGPLLLKQERSSQGPLLLKQEESPPGSISFKQLQNNEKSPGKRERNRENKPPDRDKTIQKESNERAVPISYVGSQDYSLSMQSQHHDSTEMSKTDGLEDLWREMSKAMEFTKEDQATVKRNQEMESLNLICSRRRIVHLYVYEKYWCIRTKGIC